MAANPLLDFGDDEDADVAEPAPYVIVQTLDRKVHKVMIESGDVEHFFECPAACSHIQATHLSGSEVVVGHRPTQMRLYINDKLFSNECTSFHIS